MPKRKKVNEEEQEELKDLSWEDSEESIDDADVDTAQDIVEDETESADDEENIDPDDEIEIAQPTKKKNKFNNHRLKYDSIFKGKKHDTNSDEFNPDFLVPKQSTFELVDHNSSEDNYRTSQLDEIIYQFVIDKTNIDIKASRRKPGKAEFNKNFQMLTEHVDLTLYSFADIFFIFSGYFSDNHFSMYKLLEKKWGAIIANELKIKFHNPDIDNLEIS